MTMIITSEITVITPKNIEAMHILFVIILFKRQNPKINFCGILYWF